MSELFELAKDILDVSQAGMKAGFDLGIIEGLSRAAALCEGKAALHASYLPTPTWRHNQPHPVTGKVDPDLAATCGRRDECRNLAYEIRQEIIKVRLAVPVEHSA